MSTQAPSHVAPTVVVDTVAPRRYAGWRYAVAGGVLVLGTLALRTAWAGFNAWPSLLGAGILGLAVLWFVRRVGVAAALSATIAAGVPLLLLIAVGRSAGRSVRESVTDSFPSLLTSTIPAPVTADLLAPGLVIAWAAGALLGYGMDGRRFVAPPLAATVLLIVSAALLTGGTGGGLRLIGPALVVLLLLWWVRIAHPGPGIPAGAAAAAAILGVLAVLAGLLQQGTPFQPRDLVSQPVRHVDEPNPLPMLGHWAKQPEEEILRRRGDTSPLRLAVLADYDGVSWGSQSAYHPLGTTEQPVVPPGRFHVTVDATVTWRSTSRWLPTPGSPVSVTMPPDVAAPIVDVESGSLLLPDAPKDRPIDYAVTGRVDAAPLAEVGNAGVGDAPRYLALPVLPPEFIGYAHEVTAGSPSHLHMAQALERALVSGRTFDPDAPGGSSLGRLSEFLFGSPEDGGRAGTSEQFATAYAVLARSVGLPTRVVVGFGDGEPLVGDPGSRVVRGADALAWPEVYFSGYGWIAFDPTPSPDGTDKPRPGRVAPPAARPDRTVNPTPPAAATASGRAGRSGWWSMTAVGALLIIGPLGGLAVARRRRAADQRRFGAIGAWERVEDAIVLAGLRTDRTRSATDRAAALGVPRADELARDAEITAFAPGPAHVARDSWQGAEQVVRRMRADAPAWRRAVWAINPAVWHPRNDPTNQNEDRITGGRSLVPRPTGHRASRGR